MLSTGQAANRAAQIPLAEGTQSLGSWRGLQPPSAASPTQAGTSKLALDIFLVQLLWGYTEGVCSNHEGAGGVLWAELQETLGNQLDLGLGPLSVILDVRQHFVLSSPGTKCL